MQSKTNIIFYHEDAYRQIELVPEENYFSAGRLIGELALKEESDYGIYNIVVRPEQKVNLLERKILVEEIKKKLTPISLLYSEEVETGYGSTSFRDQNTIVWGFERYGIFIKQNKDYVEAIWLCNSYLFSTENTATFLSKALLDLIRCYSLILIDWNKELICRATSEQDIMGYLTHNLAFNHS